MRFLVFFLSWFFSHIVCLYLMCGTFWKCWLFLYISFNICFKQKYTRTQLSIQSKWICLNLNLFKFISTYKPNKYVWVLNDCKYSLLTPDIYSACRMRTYQNNATYLNADRNWNNDNNNKKNDHLPAFFFNFYIFLSVYVLTGVTVLLPVIGGYFFFSSFSSFSMIIITIIIIILRIIYLVFPRVFVSVWVCMRFVFFSSVFFFCYFATFFSGTKLIVTICAIPFVHVQRFAYAFNRVQHMNTS